MAEDGVGIAATPPAWRLAAAGTLLGGALLGDAAITRPVARAVLQAGVGGALATAVPIARASRRPPIPTRPTGAATSPGFRPGEPTFSVVIAGRDEAGVLPRLLHDLAAQDHRDAEGRPAFEVIVIDDRSVDGTASVARAAAEAAGIGSVTRIVLRRGEGLPDGKGAALTALDPAEYRGEVAVILDADARVGPAFLSTLAHYARSGATAITARRRILDPASSWLAGAQADEQTADGELQRGRWGRGGLSEFRGNGITVRRDLLVALGGWRASALTEDLDLSSRVAAARGHGVAWALDAEVWEEPVRDVRSLWRQRVRWAEGALRRWLEHGPTVLRSPRPSLAAKLDFAIYGGQLLAPAVALGSVLGAVRHRRAGTALILGAGYAAAAGAVAWDALRWEQGTGGRPLGASERIGRAVRSAAFAGIWLAAVPAALWRLATRRGAVTYDKMAHDGAGEPWAA